MNPTYFLAIASASIVPALLWLLYLRSRDRYDRESLGLLISLFAWGLVSGPWASGLNVLVLGAAAPSVLDARHSQGLTVLGLAAIAALAALNEETIKYVVTSHRVLREPAFSEVLDGMVYMACLSLGFSASENMAYTGAAYLTHQRPGELDASAFSQLLGTVLTTAPQRAVLSSLGHVAWSSIVGYALGWRVMHPARGGRILPALLTASALHAAYNLPGLLQRYVGIASAEPRQLALAQTLFWGLAIGVAAVLFSRASAESRAALDRIPPDQDCGE